MTILLVEELKQEKLTEKLRECNEEVALKKILKIKLIGTINYNWKIVHIH